jgi:hypothetical protein
MFLCIFLSIAPLLLSPISMAEASLANTQNTQDSTANNPSVNIAIPASNLPNTTTTIPAEQDGNMIHNCPSVSELTKHELWWSARDGAWRSYSQSFANEIDHFLGSQWLGINVGKVICLYQGKDVFDFPIALEPSQDVLVLEPTTTTWKLEHAGYRFCKSTNVVDCPFFTKKKEQVKDIYEQLHYQGGKKTDDFAS